MQITRLQGSVKNIKFNYLLKKIIKYALNSVAKYTFLLLKTSQNQSI